MKQYKKGKYANNKERILELKRQGLTSRAIKERLEQETGDTYHDRKIREVIKIWSDNGDMDSVVDETLHRNNLEANSWKAAWVKEEGVSVLVKNPNFKEPAVIDYDIIRQDMIDEIKVLSTPTPRFKRPEKDNTHCLVLDIADLHIGKLATVSATNTYYDVDIAIERAIGGSEELIGLSEPFNIDTIYFIIGNDVLHIDTPTRTTTSGTPQDTDGMWYDNFRIARMVYAQIIQRLTLIADVHIIHCPSNHDYMSGFMLADALYCYFHANKNITFDVSMRHRKYAKYGSNMLAFSHGDGAKLDKVPYLAAHEAPQMWAETVYRYAYLHHIHHKEYWRFMSGKDFIGMTVEYMRSPSESDRWHMDNGYTGAKVAIEAFIHHPLKGQVSRITHNF